MKVESVESHLRHSNISYSLIAKGLIDYVYFIHDSNAVKIDISWREKRQVIAHFISHVLITA